MAEQKERGGFPFEKLLGNPELLSGLLSLFANGSKQEQASDADTNTAGVSAPRSDLSGGYGEEEEERSPSGPADEGEDESPELSAENGDLAPVFSPVPSRGHGHGRGKKREMLCALKPYMGHRRCEMIDKILHAADLVDLFRK